MSLTKARLEVPWVPTSPASSWSPMFMPQDPKLAAGPVTDMAKDSQAILSSRKYDQAVPRVLEQTYPPPEIVKTGNMSGPSMFPQIFGTAPIAAAAPGAATSPLGKVMAGLGANQGLLNLGKTGPSILGNEEQVRQVLRLLGINV
ncbi:MAG: hypothetical protein MZV70_36185 [Desulfobacterales bacterium]|nr:hypothetical protein [Desulfobacterales bacterium]